MVNDGFYRLVLLLGRGLFRGLRLRRRVRGGERLDLSGGAVLAITHFGYLDFALTEWAVWQRTRRLTRYLVTARAFEHPLSGPPLRWMRHIPVDRRAGASAYQHAVSALRAGELVGVFPEGQVNQDDVGPIRSGAIRMAAEADVAIIPIVVWGGQQILTKGQRFSLRRAAHSAIIISIGVPWYPGRDGPLAAADVETQTDDLRAALRTLVRESKDLIAVVPPER